MGWCSCSAWKSKDDVLRECFGFVNKGDRKALPDGREAELLDRRDAAECVWLLLSIEGTPKILVCRIAKRGGEWGEGGAWPEESGPYERGCPLHWLTIAPPPKWEGDPAWNFSADFRKRVTEEHAAKDRAAANVRGICAGDSIMLAEGCKPRGPFQVRTAPTRGSCTATGPDGRTYRLGRSLLARSTVQTRFKPDTAQTASASPSLF